MLGIVVLRSQLWKDSARPTTQVRTSPNQDPKEHWKYLKSHPKEAPSVFLKASLTLASSSPVLCRASHPCPMAFLLPYCWGYLLQHSFIPSDGNEQIAQCGGLSPCMDRTEGASQPLRSIYRQLCPEPSGISCLLSLGRTPGCGCPFHLYPEWMESLTLRTIAGASPIASPACTGVKRTVGLEGTLGSHLI